MTKSTGHNGLILAGSPPSLLIASLMAAKSTTAGTPLEKIYLIYTIKHLRKILKDNSCRFEWDINI